MKTIDEKDIAATKALKSQWRSVDNELPEKGEIVLVAYTGTTVGTYYDIAFRDEYGMWFSVGLKDYFITEVPDYWMYIPDCPERV